MEQEQGKHVEINECRVLPGVTWAHCLENPEALAECERYCFVLLVGKKVIWYILILTQKLLLQFKYHS